MSLPALAPALSCTICDKYLPSFVAEKNSHPHKAHLKCMENSMREWSNLSSAVQDPANSNDQQGPLCMLCPTRLQEIYSQYKASLAFSQSDMPTAEKISEKIQSLKEQLQEALSQHHQKTDNTNDPRLIVDSMFAFTQRHEQISRTLTLTKTRLTNRLLLDQEIAGSVEFRPFGKTILEHLEEVPLLSQEESYALLEKNRPPLNYIKENDSNPFRSCVFRGSYLLRRDQGSFQENPAYLFIDFFSYEGETPQPIQTEKISLFTEEPNWTWGDERRSYNPEEVSPLQLIQANINFRFYKYDKIIPNENQT